MIKKYDVIIIGMGPSSIFCAYELITKNKYTDSNQDNIHVLKINTLFSILNQIPDIDLKTIIKI